MTVQELNSVIEFKAMHILELDSNSNWHSTMVIRSYKDAAEKINQNYHIMRISARKPKEFDIFICPPNSTY